MFATDPEVDESYGRLRKDILHRYAHQDSRRFRAILRKAEPGGELVINAPGMFDPQHVEYIAGVLLPQRA